MFACKIYIVTMPHPNAYFTLLYSINNVILFKNVQPFKFHFILLNTQFKLIDILYNRIKSSDAISKRT